MAECCVDNDLVKVTTQVDISNNVGICSGGISEDQTVTVGSSPITSFIPNNGCVINTITLNGIPVENVDELQNYFIINDIQSDSTVTVSYRPVCPPMGTVLSNSCSLTDCRKRVIVSADGNCGTTETLSDDNSCLIESACCGTLGFSPCPETPGECKNGLSYLPNTNTCVNTCPIGTTSVGGTCMSCGSNNLLPCSFNNCLNPECTDGCDIGTVLVDNLCVTCGFEGMPVCTHNNCLNGTCVSGCEGVGLVNVNGVCTSCPSAGTIVSSNCTACNTLTEEIANGTCGTSSVPKLDNNCSYLCTGCGNIGTTCCTNNFCSQGSCINGTCSCPPGKHWDGTSCVDCLDSTDCISGLICGGNGTCTNCTDDTECVGNNTCENGNCTPCSDGDQCKCIATEVFYNGNCVECGVLNNPPCNDGLKPNNNGCDVGLNPVNGLCVPCGGLNQIACVNDSCSNTPCNNGCDNPLVNKNGICVQCGFSGNPPCVVGCNTSPDCNNNCNRGLDNINGVCTPCGGYQQASCPNNNCIDGDCSTGCQSIYTYNPSTGLCESCGEVGQECCSGTCNNGICSNGQCVCPPDTINISGGCISCGGENQIPCDANNCSSNCNDGCVGNLTPQNGLCKQGCGYIGLPACADGICRNTPCNDGCDYGSTLVNGFCQACGGENQPVCSSNNCSNCDNGCNSNYININGVCRSCGGLNQTPCSNGDCIQTPCNNGCSYGYTPSGGLCKPCGSVNEPACNDNNCDGCISNGQTTGCKDQLVNVNGLCYDCGGMNDLPCSNGSCFTGSCNNGCNTGYTPVNGYCQSCGGLNQPVCSVAGCDSPYLNDGGTCKECGGLNQPKCTNNICPSGTCINGCDDTLSMLDGICVNSNACGGDNQPPCDTGCDTGLVNVNNICRIPGSESAPPIDNNGCVSCLSGYALDVITGLCTSQGVSYNSPKWQVLTLHSTGSLLLDRTAFQGYPSSNAIPLNITPSTRLETVLTGFNSKLISMGVTKMIVKNQMLYVEFDSTSRRFLNFRKDTYNSDFIPQSSTYGYDDNNTFYKVTYNSVSSMSFANNTNDDVFFSGVFFDNVSGFESNVEHGQSANLTGNDSSATSAIRLTCVYNDMYNNTSGGSGGGDCGRFGKGYSSGSATLGGGDTTKPNVLQQSSCS